MMVVESAASLECMSAERTAWHLADQKASHWAGPMVGNWAEKKVPQMVAHLVSPLVVGKALLMVDD